MKNSIERKLLGRFVTIVGGVLLAVLVLLTAAMLYIRWEVSASEAEMGASAALSSETLLIDQALASSSAYICEKADAIDQRVARYVTQVNTLASAVAHVYENPALYVGNTNVRKPDEQIALGHTDGNVMEWIPCDEASDNNKNLVTCRKLGSLQGMLDAVLTYNPEIALLYAVSRDGYTFGMDDDVMARAGIGQYEARTMDYYTVPVENGVTYISSVYEDSFGKGSMITVSVPVAAGGETVGVFAADILVEDLETSVLEATVGNIGAAMLLNRDGTVICASDSSSESLLSAQETLASGIDRSVAGSLTVGNDRDTAYVLYAPLAATGWTLAVSVARTNIVAPADRAREEIDGLTRTLLKALDRVLLIVCIAIAALLAAGMAVLLAVMRRVCRKISQPIVSLTGEVATIGNGNLDFRNEIHTGDEVELLADSFEKMTVSLKEYIRNLTAVTAEKERIGAELHVATTIQASMLPSIFPPFPNRPEFDLFATMMPAKEVGGDFYDFFLVDQDHLALVIADVSGKGVPAALFMVIAKTLIKNSVQSGLGPAEAFMQVNAQLCESNDAEMFVTAWLGILEISTGCMRCVSAGHEYPAIRHGDGAFELIKDKHGVVLAYIASAKYREYELSLGAGDTLFVYTDGVAEATDAQNQLYGTDRMLAALNRDPFGAPAALLPEVKASIDEFVADAPQFDDITMLSIRMKPQA